MNAVATANKVTKDSIRARIAKIECAVNGKVTIAFVTMVNGFMIIGQSACVDAANFNKAEGEKWAVEDAIEQLWKLEGYLLQEQLYQISLLKAGA